MCFSSYVDINDNLPPSSLLSAYHYSFPSIEDSSPSIPALNPQQATTIPKSDTKLLYNP